MEQARILKRQAEQQLHASVEANLHLYEGQGAGFELVVESRDISELKRVRMDAGALNALEPGDGRKEGTGERDAKNALIIYRALEGLDPYLARDRRFWAYLTHFPCRHYAWHRWIDAEAETKTKVEQVRSHFFARGSRAFERANALSRLWWWARIASRYEGADLEKTLQVLLRHTDVRDAIVGRPTAVRSPKVFSAIMDVLCSRFGEDGENDFFRRLAARKSGDNPYQLFFKAINRHGGVLLLDAMPQPVLSALLMRLADEAESGP